MRKTPAKMSDENNKQESTNKGRKRQKSPSPEMDSGVVDRLAVEFNDGSDDERDEKPAWKLCQGKIKFPFNAEKQPCSPRSVLPSTRRKKKKSDPSDETFVATS